MKIEKYWDEFKKEEGLPEDKNYCEAFAFGKTAEDADKLLALVLSGKKTATSKSLSMWKLSGNDIPGKGDYSIVLDSKGEPRCVIHTIRTIIIPFSTMTYDNAQLEGEDESLEAWRERKNKQFEEEGKKFGFDVYDSMEVAFEVFEVVKK